VSERKGMLLRLDPAVHDALAKWAADELRSTNAQIEFLLRRALAEAGRLPGRAGRMRGRGRPRAADQESQAGGAGQAAGAGQAEEEGEADAEGQPSGAGRGGRELASAVGRTGGRDE
jgi:hypothetical protein